MCYRREETGEVGTVFKSQFAGDLLYVCPGVCEHPLGADDDFIPYVPCCAQSGRRPYGFVQVGGRYVHPFGIEGRASVDVHELFEQRLNSSVSPIIRGLVDRSPARCCNTPAMMATIAPRGA